MLKAVLPNGDALGPRQVWQQLPHPRMQHKLVQVPAQKTQAAQANACTVSPSAGLCLSAIRGEDAGNSLNGSCKVHCKVLQPVAAPRHSVCAGARLQAGQGLTLDPAGSGGRCCG